MTTLLLTSCFARPDALAPIITIYAPANGAVQRSGDTVVRGYAMDDEGVESVLVNGAEMLSENAFGADKGKRLVEFAFKPTEQGEGTFSANIIARDRSGRETTLAYQLSIDQTPPTVELAAPTDIGGGRLRVSGVASDNDEVKSITIGGEAVQFIPAAEYTFSVDVTAGEGLSVEVSDQAGNTVSQPVQ